MLHERVAPKRCAQGSKTRQHVVYLRDATPHTMPHPALHPLFDSLPLAACDKPLTRVVTAQTEQMGREEDRRCRAELFLGRQNYERDWLSLTLCMEELTCVGNCADKVGLSCVQGHTAAAVPRKRQDNEQPEGGVG